MLQNVRGISFMQDQNFDSTNSGVSYSHWTLCRRQKVLDSLWFANWFVPRNRIRTLLVNICAYIKLILPLKHNFCFISACFDVCRLVSVPRWVSMPPKMRSAPPITTTRIHSVTRWKQSAASSTKIPSMPVSSPALAKAFSRLDSVKLMIFQILFEQINEYSNWSRPFIKRKKLQKLKVHKTSNPTPKGIKITTNSHVLNECAKDNRVWMELIAYFVLEDFCLF